MRYLITFSYDGTGFNGYQRQKNLKTVQGEIEKVLEVINNKPVTIHGAGRTDTGVHAQGQKAHFDLDKNISLYSIKTLLNRSLKGEIYVKKVEIVSNDFHARYNAIHKTYEYLINTGEYNPLRRNYEYQCELDIDINKMKDAASYFVGVHDFRSFCAKSKNKDNCVREITNIKITKNKNIIKISVTGTGFLHKMVRYIVALLIEISTTDKDISYIKEVLASKGNIEIKKCAPACGLYLVNVKY